MALSTRPLSSLPRLLVTLTALAFSACSAPTQSTSSPQAASPQATVASATIKIDGSSTVYPITDAAAKEFKQANPGVEIATAFSGTTGGFKKFCAGETAINDASRPISTEEIEACRQAGVPYIELPVAFDALTVAVNPQNTWAQSLTVSELKKIWEPEAQGKITNWNQIRPDFPNRPLKLYGAGGQSGTYDYFAEVITGGAQTRSDYTGSEDDNVLVQGVASDPNALGFFGSSYYEANKDKLKAVAIADDSQGQVKEAVLPSRQTVENSSYVPLSRPIFIYVNGKTAQQNENLREFIKFYMANGRKIVELANAIPLPQTAYDFGQDHVFKGEYGTAYEGKPQPYLTIGEVLQKEQKL